ncbi:MAG: RidA family protein [Alphaproteobacteria bacterium]|nr:RidA family protein [Alphaproteobacteria bacterium]
MHPIEQKLASLGIALPNPPAPVAAYVPFVMTGKLAYISGQVPIEEGKIKYTGKLGDGVDLQTGAAAARLCAINVIAQIKAALAGDWGKFSRIVRVGGFVACAPGFTGHSAVINGASELFVEVFGDAGKHTRAAVGCPSLPLDAAVEVEAVAEIR